MQNVRRGFGRLGKRSADDSQVAVLLKDFDDADMLLAKIIESAKAWRDAWISIASYQSRMVDEFDGLYGPIVGSSNTPSNHTSVDTDPAILARTNKLRREYDELRNELTQELNDVEDRMIMPAAAAKEAFTPVKKTIKKRDEKKLDFEHYQGRVDSYMKKAKRSDRDNAALAKAESELANAKSVYQAADDDLRQRLPTLMSLSFSLIPYLLTAQVEIQNRMLAHYYTVLHTFCEEEGFPSPPPPMEQVIMEWERACTPAQQRIENFGCVVQGKSARQSTANPEDEKSRVPGLSNLKSRSNGKIPTIPGMKKQPAPPSDPSRKPGAVSPSPPASILTRPSTVSVSSSSARTSPLPTAGGDETPSSYMSPPQPTPQPGAASFSPAGPVRDYFSYERQGATPSSTASTPSSDAVMNLAAKKKKPPPPPPAKRAAMVVTAMYNFDAQGPDDLAFREGDRIRVVQRTNSTDDWWEGELRGRRGSFPANYVQ